MSRSKFWLLVVAPAFVLLSGANPPAAQAQHPEPAKGTAKPEAASDDKVARGRYIVEDVAMCSRCHSPLDAHGNRDTEHWLQGGAVGFVPTVPITEWAMLAPRIGGTPPGTDEEFVRLLMTGISRRGTYLRQPMPQFRMSQADAEAVLAYLKSLSSHVHPSGTQ
jgi:mono/diheme cytochrome c family protein